MTFDCAVWMAFVAWYIKKGTRPLTPDECKELGVKASLLSPPAHTPPLAGEEPKEVCPPALAQV